MNSEQIIDNTSEPIDIDAKLKKDKKKFFITICCLVVYNIPMFSFFVKNGQTVRENLTTAFSAFLIGYPILGFIIGGIVSLFPYKGLSYDKKYLRHSLLSILVIYSIFAGLLSLAPIMILLGWY